MSTIEQTTEKPGNGARAQDSIAVENPATGEIIGHVPNLSREQIEDRVRRARAAQPGWEALGFKGRARVMLAMRQWIVENRERVIETLVSESGKTYEDALLQEVLYSVHSLGFWAKKAERYLRDERIRPQSWLDFGKKLVLRYRPVGVVGVIGPWNYPIVNNFGDCIPALMAGNAVVLKPSSVTPFSSLLMAEGLKASGLPDDVFHVATGAGGAGGVLVDNCDMIMFTGSTETGRKVAEQAARRLIPVSLELGGKDPMIVLEDADLERAANAAVTYAFSNGGQTCISIERVYVHEKIYDEFVEKVTEKARQLRQGKPDGAGSVDIGAITFEDQMEVLERHVADAREKGARILTGGKRREGAGRFFEPTVLADVDHSMLIMTEETFGPTLPIMKVRDEAEAVRLANDSPYGLDSSVWSRNVARAEKVARQVQAGATCVNDALVNYFALGQPFGGVKESGLGARHGAKGIQKYCRTHSILVTRFGPRRDPNYLPYRKSRTRLLERLIAFQFGRGKARRSA
ncbi:MAG: aldehyde dehydrogenase family protein [Thermoleophilaceae bacterium]|nr:aldehyde dehydrogenase family protein [Thermoleophilaceae bacterium]